MYQLSTISRATSLASRGLLVLFAAAASAGADQIPVSNPSFESPAWSSCGYGGVVPSWQFAGAWNPGLGNTCFPLNGFPGGVPDGVQVGYINSPNTPIAQVLAATLQPDVPYTLLVDVGRRSDGFPMQDYRVRLVSNGVTLAEDPGSLSPPFGGFLTSTVSFTAPANHPSIDKPLEIHLVLIAGAQADFDNVRLFSGPIEPPILLGDVNNDGAVNGADLGGLLGSWGPCRECSNCPADFNGDCVVDASDLAILLGAWTG